MLKDEGGGDMMNRKAVIFLLGFLLAGGVFSGFAGEEAERRPCEHESFRLFLWVELIGFDNTQADYGVGQYLARLPQKPDAVSILIDNDRLFRAYDGERGEFKLPPDCCSYRARPYNVERRRQDWTSVQLKGLVAELKRQGVMPFASFFNRTDALPTTDENMRDIATRLAAFLSDFGFTGFHVADGYAPPKYLLPACSDDKRVAVARAAAARYAANVATLVSALRPKGLKTYLNTCWTRDPFEALYRYGVDYRLLAKAGLDGFIVESSAACQELEGWNYVKTSATDKSTAMLLRLKAAVPELPCLLLHGINDGLEQWSALRHSPSATRSEALALGTTFCNGKRTLDGYLACLSDGIRAEEWRELFKAWNMSFVKAGAPVGVAVVWSDRAFDAEFETCVRTHDASSNTLLAELFREGLVAHQSVTVGYALQHPELPILILNPEFYPRDELAQLEKRPAKVFKFGRGASVPYGADYVPRTDTAPFPGMPDNTTCYWKRPLSENLPQEAVTRTAAAMINWEVCTYEYATPDVTSWALPLANGRLGIFARNNKDTYATAQFRPHGCVSDVQVHTDFPSLPVNTVLESRIAPRDTVMFSVGEREFPLPDATRRGPKER